MRLLLIAAAVMLLASAARAGEPATLPTTLPGVVNFAMVGPGLYRGAQPTEEGFAQLRKLGVRTVINLRAIHTDRELLRGLGLAYVHVPCVAWSVDEPDLAKVMKLILDPANQPVFVHCQHGADRTGCTIAVYRIVHDGWTIERAVEELHAFGFHPVWQDISQYLRAFDAKRFMEKVERAKAPTVETIP